MNDKEKLTFPSVSKEQIEILAKLSNESGVSGDEGRIRKIVKELVEPYADEVKTDVLGNLIAFKKGKGNNLPKIILDAHMDEIGFMVTHDDGDGLYQFTTVGGMDARYLPGKTVLIGKDKVPAVIGAKAIHLTTPGELKTAIPTKTLRFDTGPAPKGTVKDGDYAVYATEFEYDDKIIRGKAIDDRIGVAILIALLQNSPENLDIYYVFSTQEEVGLRGAIVSTFAIQPDAAFAIDSTTANDYPKWNGEENHQYNAKLGQGPAIYAMDRATIYDPRLLNYLKATAESNNIPYQVRQPGPGGTNAGVMHKTASGIPSISISVPSRHIHSPAGIARLSDWENTQKLLMETLKGFKLSLFDEPR